MFLPYPPSLPTTIDLWPRGAPNEWAVEGAEKRTNDAAGNLIVSNVSRPRLEFVPGPNQATGDPVIVIPGGGYRILATDHEGAQVADWVRARGHQGYVLIHRLPRRDAKGVLLPTDSPRERVPLEDLARAMEIVRSRHTRRRLIVLGFSAGGHLAAVAAARSGGPDRLALIYPAYLDTAAAVAPEVIPNHAVPLFGAVATNDIGGTGRRLIGLDLYAATLRRIGGRAEVHVTGYGGHGYGFRPGGRPAPWLGDLAQWLDR